MKKNILIITKSFIEKNLTKNRHTFNSLDKYNYDKGNLQIGVQV